MITNIRKTTLKMIVMAVDTLIRVTINIITGDQEVVISIILAH